MIKTTKVFILLFILLYSKASVSQSTTVDFKTEVYNGFKFGYTSVWGTHIESNNFEIGYMRLYRFIYNNNSEFLYFSISPIIGTREDKFSLSGKIDIFYSPLCCSPLGAKISLFFYKNGFFIAPQIGTSIFGDLLIGVPIYYYENKINFGFMFTITLNSPAFTVR